MANVLASVEDYEQDRILEQQRVHDMLNEVEAAHKQKQNKGQGEKNKQTKVNGDRFNLNLKQVKLVAF